jgi:hypothetical protein
MKPEQYRAARRIALSWLRSCRRLPDWRWWRPEHREQNIKYAQRHLAELRQQRIAA